MTDLGSLLAVLAGLVVVWCLQRLRPKPDVTQEWQADHLRREGAKGWKE
jgi:hypothetical protein